MKDQQKRGGFIGAVLAQKRAKQDNGKRTFTYRIERIPGTITVEQFQRMLQDYLSTPVIFSHKPPGDDPTQKDESP